MAEVSIFQDQFSCPVCLDLLNDPVTIPCGHSYCMSCITDCWNQTYQTGVYSCPQCRQTFTPRPALCKNVVFAEVVEKLKKTKLCLKHKKLLEIYCLTDQQYICYLCTVDKHKNHDVVAAVDERTEKQGLLEETQRKFQQRIQEREKELQELRDAVESHEHSAQTAVNDTERIFTEMMHCIEQWRSEVTQLIRDKEKTAVSRAEEVLEQLKQEIDDLRRRDADLEKLLQTNDHIYFLQSFQSLSAAPESTVSCSTPISSFHTFDDVRKSASQLKEKLENFCREETEKIAGRVTYITVIPIEPKTRKDFLQYFSQFTLNTNTVNGVISLSDGNTTATHTSEVQQYPDHPDRFDIWYQVLCRESVCGRCYWEVEYSGRVFISVSCKSISRKGISNEAGFGHNNQSWSLSFSHVKLSFMHSNIETDLPVSFSSCRIGVYVDHSAGTLSFYSVSDTMTLIHTVQTTFTQPLYPGFWVGTGSTVKVCHLK